MVPPVAVRAALGNARLPAIELISLESVLMVLANAARTAVFIDSASVLIGSASLVLCLLQVI